MQGHKPKYQTILAPAAAQTEPSHDHPLFYCQQRADFLATLAEKYEANTRLPTMDLRRNARVDYYLAQHNRLKQEAEKQAQTEMAKRNVYLSSNQFATVFEQCLEDRRAGLREQQEEQRIKQQLQNLVLAEQRKHEKPVHDYTNDQSQQEQGEVKYETVLTDYRSDPMRQKQLYLLDLEMGKLQLEGKIAKKVHDSKQMVNNYELLSKLSNNILSAYLVNFDQIFSCLMDQILTEEVYYLNHMEAQYSEQKEQGRKAGVAPAQIVYENKRTIEMMELVRALEDLCDD